jgi:hypothetical protein
VLLRLLVLLITLGLSVGVVEASDVAMHDAVVCVDEVEDATELGFTRALVSTLDDDRTIRASAWGMQPPYYQHLLFVFRPPRAPLN